MSQPLKPVVIRRQDMTQQESPQGQLLTPMLYRETAPVIGLSGGAVNMPAGHVSKVHTHNQSETAVLVLDGWAATLYGEDLTPEIHGPGSVIWVPPTLVHAAVNLSTRTGLVAFEFRTDPTFNDDVQPRTDLQELAWLRAKELQEEHRELVAVPCW